MSLFCTSHTSLFLVSLIQQGDLLGLSCCIDVKPLHALSGDFSEVGFGSFPSSFFIIQGQIWTGYLEDKKLMFHTSLKFLITSSLGVSHILELTLVQITGIVLSQKSFFLVKV